METAKEKALELVNKYLDFDYQLIKEYIPNPIACAVKCAIIAVDEILSANQIWYADSIPSKYWQEVKNELNQL
jgi:hypothetical protein